MAGLINNPHYANGIYIGNQVAKHIEATTYETLEVALQRKEELVEDLKQQFGWDENHQEVAETLGIIKALKDAIASQPQEEEPSLTSEDIMNVATSINKKLSEDQLQIILERYPDAQKNDSGATWNLVVEQLIYEVENES